MGTEETREPTIRRFVVLGASGDLARRYLIPALAQLHGAGALPDGFELTGVARHDWDAEDFRRWAWEALAGARELPARARDAFVLRLRYARADLAKPGDLQRAVGPVREPLVAYLALPPALFSPTVQALAEAGVGAGSRLVVEKPFGESLASAQALNRLIHERFPERTVFRMDHFLGKQTVQNVLGLRFANRVFEPLWNGHHVEQVEIVWDETKTLEGRAGYYDSAGALRDMIQNHLLQLLALVAMEAPRTLGERDLRDRKVEVLRAVRRLSSDEVERHTVRGRYGRGRIAGSDVPAYVEEPGVDPDRGTETFAQVAVWVDNWRWAGVPFVLRTGKALAQARHEIRLRFRGVPHLAFGQSTQPVPNVLRLALEPDRVGLALNINGPGDPFDLEPIEIERTLAPQDFTAYARLLLDVVRGNPTQSIRADEAEEAWRIAEPILTAWGRGRVPLIEYPAGSGGPPPPRGGALTPSAEGD